MTEENQSTDRTAADRALRESEERYRTLAESSPDIIYILDRAGRLLYANRTAAQYIGASPADLVGKTQFDLFPPEQAKYHMERIRRVFATGEASEMVEEYRLGARSVWLNVRSIPVCDERGNVTSVMGISRNVTETKMAEQALQTARDELEHRVKTRTAELAGANERLELFRKFIEASGDGFGMADFDGRIVYANPTLCRWIAEERLEDVVGRNVSAYYPEEYMRLRKREMLPDLLKKGHWQADTWLLPRRGEPVQIAQSAFLIRNDEGTPFRIAIVASDITQRKQAEAALQRERRTLEHMLRASDHERQLIAYDIHDGLAQELAGAMMQLEIYDHLKETRPDDARRAFEGGLTLLRKGHAETRRLISGVRPPILDESGVIAAIAHLIHEPAFDRGPKIAFRSRVKFGRLAAVVENAIYRIVQEGLSNARNHSQSKKILVSLAQRGERLRIEIRDWGVGFDPQTVKESHFGLEGIRERARLLGGKCRIESSPGAGTSIVAVLPVVENK